MTMPEVWAEIAFARDTTDGSPLWRDVTDDVEWQEGVTIARRRSHELDEVQPGTLSLILNNADGRYTAGRVSSPFYPNVKINRPVRIRARWPISVNMAGKDQATSTSAALYESAIGVLTRDTGVAPAGQTASIRWDTGVLSGTGQHMWLGPSNVTTATDQGVTVVAGRQYALQVQARRGATTVSITARIRWYGADGAFLSVSAGGSVALTTSFQTVSVAATAPANAVWARLAIANATTTASNASIYTGAWQFEQAAAPTTYVEPGEDYEQYVGFVDKWPHAWEGGVRGKVALTATDRMKLLSRQRISREALIAETLATAPRFYYPLAESEGTTAAGNSATTAQPDLAIIQAGTGGTLTFGVAEGPLGSAVVEFAPVDPENGKSLGATGLTPLGGTSAITIAAWFVCASSSSGDGITSIVNLSDGTNHQRFGYNYSSDNIDFGSFANGAGSGFGFALNLRDGEPHHLVYIGEFSGGFLQQRIWVDGVQEFNSGTGIPGSSWPSTLARLAVGSQTFEASNKNVFPGYIGQVAGWNRALSTGEITALYNVGGASTELSGTRIERVLDWAGVTDVDVDAGSSELAIAAYGASSSSLQDIREAALSEGGVFFIARDGVSTFHDRARRQDLASAPLITLTADQCGPDLSFIIDDTLLFNDVTVNRQGTATRVTDDDSIEEYGQYTASIPTVLASDSDAIERGQYMLGRYAEPAPRAGQVTIEVRSLPALWPAVLGCDIGHRLTVTDLPDDAPDDAVQLLVEGVQSQITDQTWRTVLDTSPGALAALVLDDATFGTLDSNRLGW